MIFGLSLETCMSYLKSVTLTVLELLAFNATKATEPRGQRGCSPLQCWNRGSETIFSSPQYM